MDERFDVTGVSALMQRVRTGDKSALRELVSKYGGSIYSNALARTGDPGQARAIAKATLLDILSTPWSESSDGVYASWIDGLIGRNARALDLPKRAPDPAPAPAPAPDPAPAPAPAPAPEPAPVLRRLPPRTTRATAKPPAFEAIWTLLVDEIAPAAQDGPPV